MDKRNLGNQGLVVSEQGLGCMGMSEFYGRSDEGEAIATIQRALELGIDFLDTADMYGPFTNERLVGRAIADRRDEVVLATKFGNQRGEDGSFLGINGKPEYVHAACVASLERLGVRRNNPRFQGENFERNLELVERIKEIAEEKGATPGQLALAWVLAQGDDIVPIPGTKRVKYLEENAAASDIELTDDDLSRIDEAA